MKRIMMIAGLAVVGYVAYRTFVKRGDIPLGFSGGTNATIGGGGTALGYEQAANDAVPITPAAASPDAVGMKSAGGQGGTMIIPGLSI